MSNKTKEIIQVFLKLGFLGFGGPLAMISMMEEETSRKRHWVSPERFSEMVAICKVLPGPVSTQMAIYLGLTHAGLWGGVLSGVLLIFPAVMMVLGFAILYTATPLVQSMAPAFMGMQAGALGVILISTLYLALPYRKSLRAWTIGVLSAIGVGVFPSWEPWIILGFGIWGAWIASGFFKKRFPTMSLSGGLILPQLFWVCFKAGAFVFGTGLAIVPVLEGDVVQRYHWLTHTEFLDGLVIGQVTPGPVVTTATFIGYQAAGLAGAVVATIGIFLPSFFNILVLVPRVWKRISGTPAATGFVAWAFPAVIGAVLGAVFRLGRETLTSSLSILSFVTVLVLAKWLKLPAWFLIPAAGVISGVGAWI